MYSHTKTLVHMAAATASYSTSTMTSLGLCSNVYKQRKEQFEDTEVGIDAIMSEEDIRKQWVKDSYMWPCMR